VQHPTSPRGLLWQLSCGARVMICGAEAGWIYLFRSEIRTGISQPRNAITVKMTVQTNNRALFERFVSLVDAGVEALASGTGPMYGDTIMQGETKTRWRELCEQAAVKEDPKKLLEPVQQINGLLSEKQDRPEQRKPEENHA